MAMSDNALLFLHALTGLHAGTGTALGVVDLPVQRERHTGWPNVPASSLKGVLRDNFRRRDGAQTVRIFGPPSEEAEKHAGALALTDARLLFFPLRSLRGTFAWVTCRPVLDRFVRDAGLAGAPIASVLPGEPGKDAATIVPDSPLIAGAGSIALEEFEFKANPDPRLATLVTELANRAIADEPTRLRLPKNVALLHQDDFNHFVQHSTEVVARIGLDHERKTVKRGALFYEEFVPPESVFYSVLFMGDARDAADGPRSRELLKFFGDGLPNTLQIGADETIGRGLCSVKLARPQNGGAR
jgi:CRISPR-associated protein Cmr4